MLKLSTVIIYISIIVKNIIINYNYSSCEMYTRCFVLCHIGFVRN